MILYYQYFAPYGAKNPVRDGILVEKNSKLIGSPVGMKYFVKINMTKKE
jgi:hypothetical protein